MLCYNYVVLFAVFWCQNDEQYDSGSETGSESMFQTATMAIIPDVQDEGRRKFLEATKDEINDEDESSNASSDLLQPTQVFIFPHYWYFYIITYLWKPYWLRWLKCWITMLLISGFTC